jgi:hypothetical protein
LIINGDNISANVNNKIDISNPANLTDGTAALPGLAFTNDSDTGIYRPTSNSIGLSTSGVERVRIEENGGMSSVVPGGSTLLPSFTCRCWVNFDGTTAANLTGTYSQSGTTVTVTINNHGLLLGHSVSVDITSGTGVDGVYTVTGVTDLNIFTYTAGTSLTTSGNITLLRRLIRGSGNVSSVMRNGTGDYIVNLNVAMPDANYSTPTSCGLALTGSAGSQNGDIYVNTYNTNNYRILTANAGTLTDMAIVTSTVFR